ncbi:MAG: isopentenyl-diphosphate delta-isomerase [Bacteroidetes bacterium]|nr:isopentenyl-diphosphate delta-isomerase [Bacteroidota bacterium]
MEQRKNDHISLAFSSRVAPALADPRFTYEPMLGSHLRGDIVPFPFLGKTMRVPIWVSSMTGGSREAGTINRNLARACNEFGMGMGLGSCRILLENSDHFDDFNMRGIIGDELPLFANIGIVQVEEMLANKSYRKLEDLAGRLEADGLIIHVNPVQEWLQKEGDVMKQSPIDTIEAFLSLTNLKIIVKEVGQGMGPASIMQLMNLPIAAFEFAAFGGTNFAKVELARSSPLLREQYDPLAAVGHSAGEMLDTVNALVTGGKPLSCRQLIVSGGIHSFLDGYYYLSKSVLPAVYGQASEFLRYARGDYHELQAYVAGQINGLKFAKAFLQIRNR